MSKSKDYHDYVFRDGKLVGEFEEMYRNSTTTPWHQDEQNNWIDVRLTKEIIRDHGKYNEIHDLGCGTGHYLNLIAGDFLVQGGKSFGYDISETACNKAKKNFPSSAFSVMDLTELSSKNYRQTDTAKPIPVRLFIIRGTLWYVYPKLAVVVENIRNMMMATDRLLVVQNFPSLQSDFIGKDVLPNHSALVKHFSSSFDLNKHIWYESTFSTSNDNWFIGVFSPRD